MRSRYVHVLFCTCTVYSALVQCTPYMYCSDFYCTVYNGNTCTMTITAPCLYLHMSILHHVLYCTMSILHRVRTSTMSIPVPPTVLYFKYDISDPYVYHLNACTAPFPRMQAAPATTREEYPQSHYACIHCTTSQPARPPRQALHPH